MCSLLKTFGFPLKSTTTFPKLPIWKCYTYVTSPETAETDPADFSRRQLLNNCNFDVNSGTIYFICYYFGGIKMIIIVYSKTSDLSNVKTQMYPEDIANPFSL